MSEKIAKSLRLIDLLADVPAPMLVHLAQYCLIRQVRAGETIFCQTEPSPYCFGILSGQITIQRVPRERNHPPKILSVLSPGALFGEQALFKDSPRTATAVASRNGELVAIQGQKFRDWIENDWENGGLPLLVGMLQSTMSRLRQTSHELSLVYGVGRYLAVDKPLEVSFRETADFLRVSLEDVDEVAIYQRSPYWDEFEPLVSVPENCSPGVFPAGDPLIRELSALLRPVVPGLKDGQATALVPLIDAQNIETPLQGFIWAASRSNTNAFLPHTLMLLETVSTQFTESLLRHRLQDDQAAQTRLRQSRQSYTV